MTAERIPLAGVVGWPIAHSRSPQIHNHWRAQMGISGMYVPIGLKPQDFENGIRSLHRLGFVGVNITVPYKEIALNLATQITDRASLIGAANTLVFKEDGSIRADNTDGYGFIQNIKSFYPDWSASDGPALVLGAGGAARAIVSALLADHAPKVLISNRTITRASNLKEHFGARVEVLDWNRSEDSFPDVATIVNTTSLGMTGQPELKVAFKRASRKALVTDIVYNPLKTKFLQAAEDNGNRTVDGLGMLLHQAVPGFEAWFKERPEVTDELRQIVIGTL